MPDDDPIKVITVVYDPDDGLGVDYQGMNAYEAWSYLYWATDMVEAQLEGEDATDES